MSIVLYAAIVIRILDHEASTPCVPTARNGLGSPNCGRSSQAEPFDPERVASVSGVRRGTRYRPEGRPAPARPRLGHHRCWPWNLRSATLDGLSRYPQSCSRGLLPASRCQLRVVWSSNRRAVAMAGALISPLRTRSGIWSSGTHSIRDDSKSSSGGPTYSAPSAR